MIHKTAIIDASAQLASDVTVGAYSVIGPHVEIDSGTWVGPHVVINGPCKIGKDNKIFQFASVGEGPQDKKFANEPTKLIIGDKNVIREGVSLHRGTAQDDGVTKIGNDNLFMVSSHIAHDCVVGDHNIFANCVGIAGHVHIQDHVIISGFCGVHQFCHVGSHSFISHASMVVKDVPPFVMVTGGSDVTVCGINVEGLKRRGFSSDETMWLRRAYKVIYRQGLRVVDAVEKLKAMEKDCSAIKMFREFLENSKRGIIR